MLFKKIIKYFIRGYRCDSKHYIDYLKSGGAEIGENVMLFSPETFSCDVHNRHLLHIGDNVQITEYVTILMHDYSWSVIKAVTGEIIGNQNSVYIGDNVFIGMKAIILPGTKIGNNVIIGAGSVVKGSLDSNAVYAGVPAKKIMTLEEYRLKRLEKQNSEAINVAIEYFQSFAEWPKEEVFHEYFYLFTNDVRLNSQFDEKLKLMGNYSESLQFLNKHIPMYSCYDEFLQTVKKYYSEQKS